ncbi:hypothetical protein B0T14DRAFT_334438 [Immersiella caudata]|uniref:Uncharacterized protein n=1 Tax=Immersiella caudata TaxID=314043 RepID=A0AA39TYD1_9PEZI|nr:hypothetical protein B0T14DRAFT_334438 [Immersiella caudata]
MTSDYFSTGLCDADTDTDTAPTEIQCLIQTLIFAKTLVPRESVPALRRPPSTGFPPCPLPPSSVQHRAVQHLAISTAGLGLDLGFEARWKRCEFQPSGLPSGPASLSGGTIVKWPSPRPNCRHGVVCISAAKPPSRPRCRSRGSWQEAWHSAALARLTWAVSNIAAPPVAHPVMIRTAESEATPDSLDTGLGEHEWRRCGNVSRPHPQRPSPSLRPVFHCAIGVCGRCRHTACCNCLGLTAPAIRVMSWVYEDRPGEKSLIDPTQRRKSSDPQFSKAPCSEDSTRSARSLRSMASGLQNDPPRICQLRDQMG